MVASATHAPVLHVQTYAHVIDGLQGQRFDGFDHLITATRAELEFRQSSAAAGASD